jgi:hypothetical protein
LVYNLFLEYASRGTLKDSILNTYFGYGFDLPKNDVKCYTKAIVKGLNFGVENEIVWCVAMCKIE